MKALILLVCLVTITLAQKDYLALMPKEIQPGMDYHVDILFSTAVTSTVTVEASIRQTNDPASSFAWQSSVGQVTFYNNQHTGRITIMAPDSLMQATKYYVFLEVNGAPPVQPGQTVVVAAPPSLMFVQTDRGIYKPSDDQEETVVKLRVLRVDDQLKPVMGDNLMLIIKDPQGNIVMKKQDFANDKGIAEASYIVPRDPFYGTYIAEAEGDFGKANATFDVTEYVLPKFEVQLELDSSYVTDPFYFGNPNGDVDITGKVKAVYTYGALVRGTMTVSIGNIKETFENFNGEGEFSIRISRSDPNQLKDLEVFAEMTEKYTDDKANATASFTIYDAEYRALVIKPVPSTVDGEAEYKFFVQLLDASGQKVPTDIISGFGWHVTAVLKYMPSSYPYDEQSLTKTFTSQMTVSSNPVEIALPAETTEGTKAYYSSITVNFRKIGSREESLTDTFTPTKYESMTSQGLFLNIVDKTTENEVSNTETYTVDGQEICFKVRKSGTGALGNVFYQVIGNFQPGELMKMDGVVECVTILQEMAPKAMIVAYTLVRDGTNSEYLAASVTIDVLWASPHKVSITINPTEQRPQRPVTISVKTEGQAIVALDGIDKSILYLAESKSLTEDRIQSRIGEYRIFGKDNDQGSNYPGPMPMWRDYIMPFPQGPETISTGAIIKDAGLTYESPISIYGQSDQDDTEIFPVFEMVEAGINAGGGNIVDESDKAASDTGTNDVNQPQESTKRTEFPETWLFDIYETDAQGDLSFSKTCPGTITTFIVNGYGVNSKGLGVAPTQQLKCFQPFFVRLNLPYSIVKGEEFDVQILIYNYYTEDIEVTTSLKPDSAIFNLLGQNSKTLRIQSGSSQEFKVPIKPSTLGAHEITVTGLWNGITDQVSRTLRVEPPGKEIKIYQEQQVQVVDGETKTATFYLDRFFIEKEEYIVTESLKMELHVTGDMMGPFIDNLEGSMPIPTGCGEQNMITVIPSIYVSKYLKSLNRFSVDIKEKVAKYCGIGYAKELIYKHSDGSYSAFGETSGLCGCMGGESEPKQGVSWLTAFVLDSFSKMGEQQLTYVNFDILGESFDFLKNTIAADDKTFFRRIGEVIHTEMRGGTASGIPYSAYVLLAFDAYKNLLATDSLYGQKQLEVEGVIQQGVNWLLQRTDRLTSRFELAIVALVLAKNGRYNDARTLLARAENARMVLACPKPRYSPTEGVVPCWLAADRETVCDPANNEPCGLGQVCCMTDCQGYRCVPGAGPSMVESVGYLVMAYCSLDDYDTHFEKIKPLADTLLKNRKGSHFDSTQDTAVALQALAEYATRFPDQAVADFSVLVPATLPLTEAVTVNVDSSNYEILQRQPLSARWMVDMPSRQITASVAGTFGTAFITLAVSYHSTNEKAIAKTIDLTVEATQPVNGSIIHIKPCWKAMEPENKADKGLGTMQVVEVTLQSGKRYVPDKVDLQQFEIQGVTKIEADVGKVSLYFEPSPEKKYEEHCVYLPVETEMEVRNAAVGKVKVYDYYNIEETVQEAFYATEACYNNCGPPTTMGPTTGASSIYISGVLLIVALLTSIAFFRKD